MGDINVEILPGKRTNYQENNSEYAIVTQESVDIPISMYHCTPDHVQSHQYSAT